MRNWHCGYRHCGYRLRFDRLGFDGPFNRLFDPLLNARFIIIIFLVPLIFHL
jgi:hypothetical protein